MKNAVGFLRRRIGSVNPVLRFQFRVILQQRTRKPVHRFRNLDVVHECVLAEHLVVRLSHGEGARRNGFQFGIGFRSGWSAASIVLAALRRPASRRRQFGG